LDQVAVAIGDNHSGGVPRDDVASPGHRATDGVVRGAENVDPKSITDGSDAGGVGSDQVPLDRVTRGGSAGDLDPIKGVAGDDVAGPGHCSANEVVHSQSTNDHAGTVAESDGPGSIRANAVALDQGA